MEVGSMFKNMKISIKILLVIIIMSLGSLLIIFGASFYFMNNMIDEFEQTNISLGLNSSNVAQSSLLEQAEGYLTKLVQKQAQSANDTFYTVNRIVTESSQYTASLYANQENFVGKKMPNPSETQAGVACSKYFLVKGVKETPEVKKEVSILSNCEYMFAPILEAHSMLDNIYIGTESGISYRYSRSNLYNEDYDPRARDWYKAAMASPDTLVWLPTYLDSYGNTCITAAMSYRDKDGNLAGVVASDVLLTSMIDDVMSLSIGESGSCFVLDAELNFIAHPDMNSESFDNTLSSHFDGDTFVNALRASDDGIVETGYEGNNCYVAFSRMNETGWFFCASIMTDEVTAPAIEAKDQSDQLTKTSQEQMQSKLFSINKLFMIYFAIIGIVVIMISFVVSGTITRPIQKLANSVKDIGKGNFDQKIPVETGGEIGMLVNRFNEMQDNLKEYLDNIQKITAEKERISAELSVATQIQADMLPSIFPYRPDRPEFDVFATMNPAKEVGGDFYDFFMTDENHLVMVMADVSGKGVPAALFMVIAKTLIKSITQNSASLSPAEILEEVNNRLCEGNEAEMFVTVWIGILNLTTGDGVAANAGHEHPALKRRNGKYELCIYKHSPALATFEGLKFKEHTFKMNPGDSLYVYTDGVPEATDANDKLYGTDRMLDALNRQPDARPEQILENVKQSVDTFVGDAVQFDDMTMLCMSYFGAEGCDKGKV